MNRTFEKKSNAELLALGVDAAWSYILVDLEEEVASCFGDESEDVDAYVADLRAYSASAAEFLATTL